MYHVVGENHISLGNAVISHGAGYIKGFNPLLLAATSAVKWYQWMHKRVNDNTLSETEKLIHSCGSEVIKLNVHRYRKIFYLLFYVQYQRHPFFYIFFFTTDTLFFHNKLQRLAFDNLYYLSYAPAQNNIHCQNRS